MNIRFLGLGGHGVGKGPFDCFSLENVSVFCCISFKKVSLLALVSEFTKDVSFVVGAPWRCGVLTKIVRDSRDWLGHPLGREHDSSSRVGWRLLAC